VDYKSIGLENFGNAGNYYARQISRWARQYDSSKTKDIPAMDKVIDWLPKNIPVGDDVSIVHGDLRLDNMIFHPTEPKVIGILDWELSTLGHPLADLAYKFE
jgi:aminoglycoside phosphotransferase (APT) family kinase protein